MADMVYLEAQPSKEDLKALQVAVNRVINETGRSLSDSITFAAVKVAQSGRSSSKIGKKNRPSIDNPEYREARGSFAWARKQQREGKAIPIEAQLALNDLNSITPFLIIKKTQGETYKIPSWEKKDPRRLIEMHVPGAVGGRGLAKATWNIMAAKMASSKGRGIGTIQGSQYRVSKYQEKYGAEAGAVVARLVNSLSYLQKAYPGIASVAVRKGTAALNGQMDRKIKASVQKANKGRA
jgi:hypothetical protein